MDSVKRLVCAAIVRAATGVSGAEKPQTPLPTWPWPGPTPPEQREAMLQRTGSAPNGCPDQVAMRTLADLSKIVGTVSEAVRFRGAVGRSFYSISSIPRRQGISP